MSQNNIVLSKGYPSYIYDCIYIAQYFKTKLILNATPEGKFYVIIENVFIDEMPHKPIQGLGITISDACNDYMRQARGSDLINITSSKTGNFV